MALPPRSIVCKTRSIILQELENLAAELAIEILYDNLEESKGGLCRFGGRSVLYINRSLCLADRIRLLVAELSGLPLEGVFLRPGVRELLEANRSSAAGV